MIGLRIAAACAVVFFSGLVLYSVSDKNQPLPVFLRLMAFVGTFGIPVGLILAIFGV